MGGPMNIYEHRNFPWLVEEKRALRSAIDKYKPVIGICLGSQLIADVLGGKIYQNPEMEIGWFPVRLHKEAASIAPFARFPEVLTPLHWHGDTFSLPDGAVPIAESVGCKNQAFAVGDRIIGLQFHLEVGMKDVAAFVDAEPSLGSGRFIQTPATILELGSQYLSTANSALFSMLTALEGVRL
jgi:GMP synthase-like glutamine amidotransferase